MWKQFVPGVFAPNGVPQQAMLSSVGVRQLLEVTKKWSLQAEAAWGAAESKLDAKYAVGFYGAGASMMGMGLEVVSAAG